MTPDDPRHGSNAGYNVHVKDNEPACFPCRLAAANDAAHVRREKAYGRWAPWTDPEPARRHVRWLMREGMPLREIATAVNVYPARISQLLYGRSGGEALARIRPDYADALLNLRPVAARVNSLGAARRLQALVAVGHSTGVISERLGITYSRVDQLANRREPFVMRDTHDRIAALYDAMCMVPPCRETRGDRQRSTRALSQAKARGWLPPLAWDDIDDPNETPTRGEVKRDSRGRPAKRDPLIENAEWLADDDLHLDNVLDRLNVTRDAFHQACRRAERLDLYHRLMRRVPGMPGEQSLAVQAGIRSRRGAA